MHIIYKTTNKINNKIYIGVHNGNNEKYIGSGVWLKRAIKKYGRANFVRETIQIYESAEAAFRNEQNWIDFYRSNDPLIGYNISCGGFGNKSDDYQRHEKIRKGVQESFKKGRTAHNKGKHVPDELKARIRNTLQKRARETNQRFASGNYITPKGDEHPRASEYILQDPSGIIHTIRGDLHDFCLTHKLSKSSLYYNCEYREPFNRGKNKGWKIVQWAVLIKNSPPLLADI
jgi:hypothetical protein